MTTPDDKTAADKAETGRAAHGSRTEVNWDQGQGRQPYANQGEVEGEPPNGAGDIPAGDRGERSGRNQDQLDEAKRTR